VRIKSLFRRRISAGRAFIPEIDGLRFIAILSVVLFHVNAQMLRYYPSRFPTVPSILLDNGDRGVRLFFVISGFILALPFARYHFEGGPPLSLKRYFVRRLTRLEPPYLASLLILSVLAAIVLHDRLTTVVVHLLATATYCHNLIFGQLSTISTVAWSLEIEVQFYILVPMMANVFALRSQFLRRSLLVGIILISGVLQAIFPGPMRWQLSIGFYIQFFLVGFLLADIYLGSAVKQKTWAWDAVSTIAWPLVFLLPKSMVQYVLPFLILLLYWAAFNGNIVNSLFRNTVIVSIGGACYSIYLLHFPAIAFASRIVGHSRTLLFWLFSLILIPAVSAPFFLLIEKPCMNPNWPLDLVNWIRISRGTGSLGWQNEP